MTVWHHRVTIQIGKGTIVEIEPRIYGAEGTEPKYYDGMSHMAWQNSFNAFPVRFLADETDKKQYASAGILDGTSIRQWNTSGYGIGSAQGKRFGGSYTLYYSLDEQKTWTDVVQLATDRWDRNGYFVKNAGSYPFYLKIESGNNVDFIQKYTAVIQPVDLTRPR